MQPASSENASAAGKMPQSELPGITDHVAVARLYGEPLFDLPQDLYIPPDALEVFLEAFEGPLDLLLYLIRRQNFDILDIPMARLTEQYLGYVDEIRHHNLELAAEYLLMAAMLIEIKSRMLLPARPVAEEEEVEDPRAELVRRLLAYEAIKLAAGKLDALPQMGRDFLKPDICIPETRSASLPDINAGDLHAAWQRLLQRSRLARSHTVTRAKLSMQEHMTRLLKLLDTQKFAAFEELFDPSGGVPVLVVTLMALLELARQQLVQLSQTQGYTPIYVRLRGSPA